MLTANQTPLIWCILRKTGTQKCISALKKAYFFFSTLCSIMPLYRNSSAPLCPLEDMNQSSSWKHKNEPARIPKAHIYRRKRCTPMTEPFLADKKHHDDGEILKVTTWNHNRYEVISYVLLCCCQLQITKSLPPWMGCVQRRIDFKTCVYIISLSGCAAHKLLHFGWSAVYVKLSEVGHKRKHYSTVVRHTSRLKDLA